MLGLKTTYMHKIGSWKQLQVKQVCIGWSIVTWTSRRLKSLALDCLSKSLFGVSTKRTSKFPITGRCGGNQWSPIDSSHKYTGLVKGKLFQWYDVIIKYTTSRRASVQLYALIIDIYQLPASNLPIYTNGILICITHPDFSSQSSLPFLFSTPLFGFPTCVEKEPINNCIWKGRRTT